MLKKFIFESKVELQINARDYYNFLKTAIEDLDLTEERAEELLKYAQEETIKLQKKNLNNIIIPALKALESSWNGSNVFVVPNIQTNYEYGGEKFETSPMEDSYIYVTKDPTIDENLDQPSFTLFVSGEDKMVEDVLEAGDGFFFKDPDVEADYFNLVNFLKNGKVKKNKIISVYTARPAKDREQLQNLVDKNLFPKNIFVTTSENEAEGYAYDLATTEKRDLWFLKINEKYLIQTLDVGHIKNYQTFSSSDKFIPIEFGKII